MSVVGNEPIRGYEIGFVPKNRLNQLGDFQGRKLAVRIDVDGNVGAELQRLTLC